MLGSSIFRTRGERSADAETFGNGRSLTRRSCAWGGVRGLQTRLGSLSQPWPRESRFRLGRESRTVLAVSLETGSRRLSTTPAVLVGCGATLVHRRRVCGAVQT